LTKARLLYLLANNVPDETTILNFRHLLEEHKLQESFFEVVNTLLLKKGLLMKEGTIVDATIIAAPSSTKNRKRKRDPEMSQTKKGNQWYFGLKAHIGTDAQSGLVHHLEVTTAKTHDRVPFQKLLHQEEKAVFGDKGYFKKADKTTARANGIFWGVTDRADPKKSLSNSQKRRNKKHFSVRAKVEHPFRVIKCQWKFIKVRYKGLSKNTMQLYTLFALSNLYQSRNKLLAT
jgi:IS5 family transposase